MRTYKHASQDFVVWNIVQLRDEITGEDVRFDGTVVILHIFEHDLPPSDFDGDHTSGVYCRRERSDDSRRR